MRRCRHDLTASARPTVFAGEITAGLDYGSGAHRRESPDTVDLAGPGFHIVGSIGVGRFASATNPAARISFYYVLPKLIYSFNES